MTTSNDFLCEDQFQCSICLDIFTEPVSTPCGHTFCKDCLTRHWVGKKECQCPLCNNKLNKDLKLNVNTTFREIVDNFKKRYVTADATSTAKPGEVSCDLCPANKLRASKTCLVCLASFCKNHLEPHLTVAALQRHELSNPVPDLENKICRDHNRILEYLCLDDDICFCALCTEHDDHDTASLTEQYIDQRSHLWRRKENKMKNKRNRKPQNEKNNKNNKTKHKGKGEIPLNMETHQMTGSHPFNGCSCMFHNPGIINGKAFYDFQVNGRDDYDLAAVRESTLATMRFPPNIDDSCFLRFRVRKNTNRILVLVDNDYGFVLILDPDNGILMHKFTGSLFYDKVLLCFIPSNCGMQGLKRRVQGIGRHLMPSHWCIVVIVTLIFCYMLHCF